MVWHNFCVFFRHLEGHAMLNMCRPIAFCAAALLLVCNEPNVARANLIQNGDFAGGSADWTFAVQNVLVTNGAQAATGPCAGCSPFATFDTGSINGKSAWLEDLDFGFGTISQTLVTTPGQTYRIRYLFESGGLSPANFFAIFAGKAYLPADALVLVAPGQFEIAPPNYLQNPPHGCPGNPGTADDVCGLFFGGDTPIPNGVIEEEEFTAMAISSLTTIEFAGASFTDFLVTDVSVVPLPEPATIALFPVGLITMGFIWLWRSRRLLRL